MELKSFDRLVESLSKLPSVGRKSAERMVYAMLNMDEEDLKEFSESVLGLSRIHRCSICGTYTEEDICDVCKDDNRDKTTLMVVSYPKDMLAFEKSEGYDGLYHILNGAISTSKGVGIEDLNIESLFQRLDKGDIKEVILATNPNVDGETTALYLSKKLEKYDINITRLAYGLQIGSALDYTDSLTLNKALQGRHKM